MPEGDAPATSTKLDATASPEHITERRIVAVLFADVVGFTPLAEARDAEEVRDVLDRYFAVARQRIARYGGTTEKFIGDAVMAVWGAPVAREDDAERAVRTGLELVEAVAVLGQELGIDGLALRVGIVTGEAAVTLGSSGEALVAGDIVNTASRLQSVAPSGSVLVDEGTFRAARDAIAFEPIGEQALRGKAMPVAAWQALRVVAGSRGAGRQEGLEAPFFGREGEYRLLRELVHATAAERRPTLVSIIGVPGIGKSRLAWELEKYIDGIVGDVFWHHGRSPAYGEGITFWALAEMVRGRAGIAETDEPSAARTKLDTMLKTYLADEAERQWIGPRLGALLGLEPMPATEQADLFSAWRRLLERIAERGPTVLVFEDLQWADQGLIDFVESILEWSRSSPILVVVLARPELYERRPGWGARQRNFTSLHLEPLAEPAMRKLLAGLVPGLPAATVRRILDRAEGVPLYAVETVRMLVDQGRLVADDGVFRATGTLDRIDTPTTLRSLIAARLDGLDATDRAILQDAAVLGQSFTVPALAALRGQDADRFEPRLQGLVARELLTLQDDPLSPERGQFAFVQGLVREVAHETLARRDRRTRHLAAARYFETLEAEEIAGVLASHYLEAYRSSRPGPDADAVGAQARVALRGAADRARALHSNEQALAFLEQALSISPALDDPVPIWEEIAALAQAVGRPEVALDYARRAFDRHRERDDPHGIARIAAQLGRAHQSRRRTVDGLAVMEPAVEELAAIEGTPEFTTLLAELARAYMMSDDPRAIPVADRALVAAERLGLVAVIVEALVTKANALETMGRPAERMALLRGAVELADSHGLAAPQLRALANYIGGSWVDGAARVADAARRGYELASRLGEREWAYLCAYNLALAQFVLGEWDEADRSIATVEQSELPDEVQAEWSETAAQLAGFRGDEVEVDRRLAVSEAIRERGGTRGDLGDRDLAWALAHYPGRPDVEGFDRALRAARSTPVLRWVSASCAGRIALALHDAERTRTALAIAELANEHGRNVEALFLEVRAGLLALEGRVDEATAAFREVVAIWRELGQLTDLGICLVELATLLGADVPEARRTADEARALWTRLGSPPMLERLEASLAHSTSSPVARRRC